MYEGEWNFNRMHGKGILYLPTNFIVYNGEWFRDKMQGFGVLNNQYLTK